MTIIAPSSGRISLAGQDRESSASKRYPPRATVSDGRGLVRCRTRPRINPPAWADGSKSDRLFSNA
jgi:hypothetical protein